MRPTRLSESVSIRLTKRRATSRRSDALTRHSLASKAYLRRRGALSPDDWDAVAHTFAKPGAPPAAPSRFWRKIEYPKTGWM